MNGDLNVDTPESFTEFGVRWRAGDFTTVQPQATEADARAFATLVNPTGDARAEIVRRTVTRTDWQSVDNAKETNAR